MPRVDHPDLFELLEWLTKRAEVFDPARVQEHVDRGCPDCLRDLRFLEDVGSTLRKEEAYEGHFDDLTWATDEERARLLARFQRVPQAESEDGERARLAMRVAELLLIAMERGPETLFAALRTQELHEGYAILYALQRAAPLVPKDPQRILDGARVLGAWSERYPAREDGGNRELLRAEAALLEAQCLTSIGRTRQAIVCVKAARSDFLLLQEPGLNLALCDFWEGSAQGFVGEHERAETLLQDALGVFRELGLGNWEGRALAGLATSISQRGDDRSAQPLYDQALGLLDPDLDASAYIQTLINKASSLANMKEMGEAKRVYARALSRSLKAGTRQQLHMIRMGLAEIDFRNEDYQKALASYQNVLQTALAAGYEEDVLLSRLYTAEILGRLGRDEEMHAAVKDLRESRGSLSGSAALDDLFSCLDKGDLSSGVVTHVREHLEHPTDSPAYVPFRQQHRR